MAKYLLQVNYTAEGARGLMKDGGTKRRHAAQALAESLGGRLEEMYYAFGDTDVIVIVDMPDAASMAAVTLALGATGAVTGRTTVLMTCEEMDQAAHKSPKYRPPGQ